MKLASYRDGSRDGQLVVVSRDLATAHYATGICTRLQQVLDDWNFLSPQLQELSRLLDQGRSRHAFAFDPARCEAPLPRAFQFIDGPSLRQRAGDALLGPRDPLVITSERLAPRAGPGLAVVTGDLPQAVSAEAALDGVRLVMLVNGWTLAADGAGLPPAAFAPVAVTPDELGAAWQGGRLRLPLQLTWNGRRNASVDAQETSFGELIATLARTRALRAGCIVGHGAPTGDALDAPLKTGDTLRVEVIGADGQSVFGAIDQDLQSLHDEPALPSAAD